MLVFKAELLLLPAFLTKIVSLLLEKLKTVVMQFFLAEGGGGDKKIIMVFSEVANTHLVHSHKIKRNV